MPVTASTIVAVLTALLLPPAEGPAAESQDAAATAAPESGSSCISADQINGYKVESDELVRFTMHDGSTVLARLHRTCPQLHFHGYISYTPVNGQLCAKVDDIKTRSGMPCKIETFTKPDPDKNTAAQP